MRFLYLVPIMFLLALTAAAQEEVSLPRDVAEKALKALELVPVLEDKIEKLETEITELERAKLTPCTIAQEKVKNDLVFWLDRYAAAGEAERPQIEKVIRDLRRTSKKLLAAQCDYAERSDFMKTLDVGSRFLPLLLIFK